jgi:hypothetical protein
VLDVDENERAIRKPTKPVVLRKEQSDDASPLCKRR